MPLHRRTAPRRLALAFLAAFLPALLAQTGCENTEAPVNSPALESKTTAGARRLHPFELEDQHGQRHSYDGTSATPVALFISQRGAAESNQAWDEWILPRYGDSVRILRVLDLSDVPGVFQGVAVSMVKKRVQPPETPVLLDWEGELCRRLQIENEATNLFVADSSGQIVLAVTGTPETERTTQVVETLDPLLSASAPPG